MSPLHSIHLFWCLTKAWNPLGGKKKNLRFLAQPVMHCLLNFFIRPELASNSSSFRAPNTWKSEGARSVEYSGWGRHSKWRSLISATVAWTVCDQASSWSSKTQVVSSHWHLDQISGFWWFTNWPQYDGCLWSPNNVMLQNWPPTVPEQWQHHSTCWRLSTKFFGFRWSRMLPCCSPCFWLEIISPAFTTTYYALKTNIPFSLTIPQMFFTGIHILFPQFWCELSWNPSCTQFFVLKYIMHNMVSKLQGNLNSCNKMVFLYHSFNVHHSLWCIGSVRATCAFSISYTWHHIL